MQVIVFACYPKIVSQNEKKNCLNILKFYPTIRAFKQLGPGRQSSPGECVLQYFL